MTPERRALLLAGAGLAWPWRGAVAGTQAEEPLADSVRLALAAAVNDSAPPRPSFDSMDARLAYIRWLGEMSNRLRKREAEHLRRIEFLETAWYESKRAALEPSLLPGWCRSRAAFASTLGLWQIFAKPVKRQIPKQRQTVRWPPGFQSSW